MRYSIALTAFVSLAASWIVFTPQCMDCDRPPPFGQGGYAETVRWAAMYQEACDPLPQKIFHRLKPYDFDLTFKLGSFSEDAGDVLCGG